MKADVFGSNVQPVATAMANVVLTGEIVGVAIAAESTSF